MMASSTLLFLTLMVMSVCDGKSTESLVTLNCKPALGEINLTTHISCRMECQNKGQDPTINTVVINRSGVEKPCFTYSPHDNETTGDSRFKAVSNSSLQLQNTAISDEGEYIYMIRTQVGDDTTKFTINVTAKYNNPDISSVPKKIEEYGPAELHCTASGGYPAGTIHWFDQSNTNWTKNSVLQTTRNDDGLYTLSSKLSFQSFDPIWAPLKCTVLNNRYQEEGGRTFNLQRKDDGKNTPVTSIAGVVVIGSLVAGLLVALLCRRRRVRQLRRASALPILSPGPSESPQYYEEEEALNGPICTKTADEQKISV